MDKNINKLENALKIKKYEYIPFIGALIFSFRLSFFTSKFEKSVLSKNIRIFRGCVSLFFIPVGVTIAVLIFTHFLDNHAKFMLKVIAIPSVISIQLSTPFFWWGVYRLALRHTRKQLK